MILEATGYELEPTPWSARAACTGSNPDLWFPERGVNPDDARAICATCPVRRECVDYAVRWDIQFGIWGGLSVRERRRLGRSAGRPHKIPAPHGTTTRYAQDCRCLECCFANTEAAAERRQLQQPSSRAVR